jgi:hypothetical protein
MLARVVTAVAIAVLLPACSQQGVEEAEEAVPRPEPTDTVSAQSTASAPESARVEVLESGAATPGETPDAASEPPAPEHEPPAPREVEPVVSPSGLHVIRAYVCKGIEESEPTEAGRSFIAAGDGVWRLCCFSEIGGVAGSDAIVHVWYWGDREMARVELPVRAPRWRTWSNKRILDEWRGEWHVDIADSEGTVLRRLEFSVE